MTPRPIHIAAPAAAFAIMVIHLMDATAGVVVGSTFALLGLFVLGIPHGSLDHVIEEQGAVASGGKTFSLWRFLVAYLSVMAIYALVWVGFPGLSLVFFLLLSAWHFGETDLQDHRLGRGWLAQAVFVGYGSVLLFGLLANDAGMTREILASLLGANEALDGFVDLVEQYPWLRFSEFFALALGGALVGSGRRFEYLRLGVILGIALFLPLLEGFLLYFCHHHAWLNMLRVKKRIYGEGRRGLYAMLKDMAPFSLISVVGIVILVASSPLWLSQVNPVLLFFILISVLTLPHAGVMSRFYDRQPGAAPAV